MKQVQRGNVVKVASYHFDDQDGQEITKSEMPCRILTDHSDFKEGYCNLYPSDFDSGSGRAWLNEDGTITLIVHSNCNYDLKLINGATLAPVTPAKFHAQPKPGGIDPVTLGVIEAKLKTFADLVTAQQRAGLIAKGYDPANHNHDAHFHMGQKFARVDVGHSGKYMVDLAAGIIYGIKGYGVVHHSRVFGTLDTINDWDWSSYRAIKRTQTQAIPA